MLKDKVILIVGCSRGIGRAVALACAAEGAIPILLARTIPALENLYDEISTTTGIQASIYPFNLQTATPDDYGDLITQIKNTFGQLDSVIYTAGILGTLTPLEHYPIDQWYQVFQTHLHSPYLLTQASLPLLRLQNNAVILFTHDQIAQDHPAYWGAYSMSQSALHAFAKTLAKELEQTSIHIEHCYPKPTRTHLRQKAYPAEDPRSLNTPEQTAQSYLKVLKKRFT